MSGLLDLAVYIGRFQPLHNGHMATIRYALTQARRVIVLVGSHDAARSIRNPFSSKERYTMFKSAFTGEEYNRLLLCELEDFTYNDQKWVARVQEIVAGLKAIYGGPTPRDTTVGITGFDKDSSTYYLRAFPQWEHIMARQAVEIDATQIRDMYFDSGTICTDVLPEAVAEYLTAFRFSDAYAKLKREHQVCKDYMIPYKDLPFPPTFHTVDNVVIQAGHILLIRRGTHPGEGLWALPGGYIGVHETLEDAALRELKEETKIDCPLPVLRGSIKARDTFDDPKRSSRSRTITTAFLIHLQPAEPGLHSIKGSDDADKASWFTLNEFYNMRNALFEDHFSIACNMLAKE